MLKEYQENRVLIEVETNQSGVLILNDSFYPGWQALIDGEEIRIYRADYHLRGIIIPEGSHQVVFQYGEY